MTKPKTKLSVKMLTAVHVVNRVSNYLSLTPDIRAVRYNDI